MATTTSRGKKQSGISKAIKAVGETLESALKTTFPGDAPSDAIALLEDDHRTVEQLFKEFESAKEKGDNAARKRIVASICRELEIHTTIEEEIFYPAFRAAAKSDEDRDRVDEAEVEHMGAKELVAQLKNASPASSHYDAKVQVLSEQITHHVKEEESELFPDARSLGLDMDALGARLLARKQQLKAGVAKPVTHGLARPITARARKPRPAAVSRNRPPRAASTRPSPAAR